MVTVGGLRKHNAMRSSSVPSETSEKENAGENSARVSVASDLDSVKEEKQRVHDILLRADLLGLMNDDAEDKGVFSSEDYDVTGNRRPVIKSSSTSVLNSTGNAVARRRRLRPKSAGRSRGGKLMRGSASVSGMRRRPQSASRSRGRR